MHTAKNIKVTNYKQLVTIFETYNQVFQIKSFTLKNGTKQIFEINFRHREDTKIETVLKEFKKLIK